MVFQTGRATIEQFERSNDVPRETLFEMGNRLQEFAAKGFGLSVQLVDESDAGKGLKLLRLMFGPRLSMLLLLVWRQEPLTDGRTSIRRKLGKQPRSDTSNPVQAHERCVVAEEISCAGLVRLLERKHLI